MRAAHTNYIPLAGGGQNLNKLRCDIRQQVSPAKSSETTGRLMGQLERSPLAPPSAHPPTCLLLLPLPRVALCFACRWEVNRLPPPPIFLPIPSAGFFCC